MEHRVKSRSGFLFLLRGVLEFDTGEGGYRVRTTGPQGSGILSSLSKANALIVVPEDRHSIEAGEIVRVQLLPSFHGSIPHSNLR
jgi:molybdopterin molybdotransferase